jgi:tetratricopeptide (TPR) repeat protein
MQVRVGLNAGEVVVRGIRTDVRLEYTAVGHAAHLAARMEQLARPGTILLTESIVSSAEGHIDIKPLGSVPVKGMKNPVQIYELLGARPAPTRFKAFARHGGLSRFVGREAELAFLIGILSRVQTGYGQIVALVGEPGIGKSRLAYELQHSLDARRYISLQGRSVSYGQRTAYLSVASLLKAHLGVDANDSVSNICQKVEAGIAAIESDAEDIVSAILWLFDISGENPRVSRWIDLDPAVRRQRTIDALKRFILQLSKLRPLIVLFEDLQWMDVESQAMLEALVEVLSTAPILLLVTYRNEYEHGWGTRAFYSQIRVEPLPPKTVEIFLSELLGSDANLESLKKRLIQNTEGNPFFLEECVRSLADAQALAGTRGTYRLNSLVEELSIPSSVKSVLAARIDRLSLEDKGLLQTAAVIGKDIPLDLISAAVGRSEKEVEARLEVLQGAEFIYETKASPREFTFKHALTHDVAYAGLVHERRRTLHGAVLAAIERVYANRLPEHVEALGRHAVGGGVWAKAVTYLRQAGIAAAMRSAYRDSTTWHRSALDALNHLAPGKESFALGIDIRFELHNSLLVLGDHVPIFDVLIEAERLGVLLGDERRIARLHGYLAMALWWIADYDRAIDVGERAVSSSRKLGRPGLEGIALVALGWTHHAQGNFKAARAVLARVLELAGREPSRFAGRGGAPTLSVMALSWLACCDAEQGEFEQGLLHANEAVRAAEEADHPWSRAAAYFGLSAILASQTEYGAAIRVLERGLRLCESNDIISWRTTMAWNLGHVYVLGGDPARGMPLLEQGVSQAAADRCFAQQALRVGWLAEARLLAGHLTHAADLADEALRLARNYKESLTEGHVLRILGDIAAARNAGDRESGREYYEQALSIAERLSMRPLQARCLDAITRLST